MVLTTNTTRGDPRGVPANCAHTGFLNNDDWELEDGEWVPADDDDVWMGVVDPSGEDIPRIQCQK